MHLLTKEETDSMKALLKAKLEKYGQPMPRIEPWCEVHDAEFGYHGYFCMYFTKRGTDPKQIGLALDEFAAELGCRKEFNEYESGVGELDGEYISMFTHPAVYTPEDYVRIDKEADESMLREAEEHERQRQAEHAAKYEAMMKDLAAGKLRSKTDDGFLVMAGEFYDDIESGEKTVEIREFSEYNLKRTIGLKTIRLQRGYGHPGKPPKKMRYEVVKTTLADEYGNECDPFKVPDDFEPEFINIYLGKRID